MQLENKIHHREVYINMEDKKTLNEKLAEQSSRSTGNTDKKLNINTIIPTNDNCNTNGLLALIGLLIVVSSIGWYMYFDIKSEKTEIASQLIGVTDEKEEVTNELKELIVQYEDMKSDNDTVNKKLAEEQARIEGLLEELQKVKRNNSWQIHKYKKELSTLRKIMKSYIYQIDSLNTMNINLRQENSTVTAQNRKISSKNKKLEELTNNLSSTVEKASILRAINIVPMATKKKGKETNRIKKVEKIRVCFTLAENAVAKSGAQYIYLQIINPEGEVLSGDQNVITFGEQEIQFSDRREIEYDNKDIDICIYWAKSEKLTKGEYKVNIISNGYIIGNSAFYLK